MIRSHTVQTAVAVGAAFSSCERLGKAAAAQRLGFHLMSWGSSLRETGGCVSFPEQCSLIPEALIWAYVICDNIWALFSIVLVSTSGAKWVFRNVLQNCSEFEKQGSSSSLKILCIYFMTGCPRVRGSAQLLDTSKPLKMLLFSSHAFSFIKRPVKRWEWFVSVIAKWGHCL